MAGRTGRTRLGGEAGDLAAGDGGHGECLVYWATQARQGPQGGGHARCVTAWAAVMLGKKSREFANGVVYDFDLNS